MIHSRRDYRFVVDLRTTNAEDRNRLTIDLPGDARVLGGNVGIPEDEPVFLLRAQDACALVAVAAYVEAARAMGADEIADKAEDWLEAMRNWQTAFRTPFDVSVALPLGRGKVPDLPTVKD